VTQANTTIGNVLAGIPGVAQVVLNYTSRKTRRLTGAAAQLGNISTWKRMWGQMDIHHIGKLGLQYLYLYYIVFAGGDFVI